MKTITIDGVTFELYNPRVKPSMKSTLHSFQTWGYGYTVDDVYTRPSDTKRAIYKEWERWAYKNDVEYFGITGHNCMTFTLGGIINIDGQWYYMTITKCHNKLTPMEA